MKQAANNDNQLIRGLTDKMFNNGLKSELINGPRSIPSLEVYRYNMLVKSLHGLQLDHTVPLAA